ncbi:ComF family protein [Cognatitamlana onchidii]|uniref:ComF family protein n=1 Tax=Cognatitamlana onchidii TaxID=2562860 RepID=UPI001F24C53C|nr:phosphoribosyltransferase family protein [Algibacter onchidii]
MNLLQDHEDSICIDCRHHLPVTNFHFNNNDSLAKVLYGRAKIELGTALFRFEKKGNVQRLIHNLKYKGHENIGCVLGKWLGGELKTIAAYQNIDMVIPVPLHEKKLRKRGFNQVSLFGQEIAKCLNALYTQNNLVKITKANSQTQKKRFSRWHANDELFALKNASALDGKHVLLVDDIVTTGATLEACIAILNESKNITVSVATMAIA